MCSRLLRYIESKLSCFCLDSTEENYSEEGNVEYRKRRRQSEDDSSLYQDDSYKSYSDEESSGEDVVESTGRREVISSSYEDCYSKTMGSTVSVDKEEVNRRKSPNKINDASKHVRINSKANTQKSSKNEIKSSDEDTDGNKSAKRRMQYDASPTSNKSSSTLRSPSEKKSDGKETLKHMSKSSEKNTHSSARSTSSDNNKIQKPKNSEGRDKIPKTSEDVRRNSRKELPKVNDAKLREKRNDTRKNISRPNSVKLPGKQKDSNGIKTSSLLKEQSGTKGREKLQASLRRATANRKLEADPNTKKVSKTSNAATPKFSKSGVVSKGLPRYTSRSIRNTGKLTRNPGSRPVRPSFVKKR